MAFNPAPSAWIPGWSADADDIVIADAFGASGAFPELDAAEAGYVEVGDIRRVLFAMCQELANTWYATASADRPTKMSIARSSPIVETTGLVTRTFTFRFTTSIVEEEVVSE